MKTVKKSKVINKLKVVFLIIFAIVICSGAWIFMRPLQYYRLQSNPEPQWSYERAVEKMEQLKDAFDTTVFNPLCRPQLLTRGTQTQHVIVLIHNYTNCPRQCHTFANCLFEEGYNVVLLPLPRHGYKDRLTGAQAGITAEELVAYTDGACDIASMIGKKVVVVGFSAGALMAAWAGQVRSDVTSVLLVTPIFNYRNTPFSRENISARLLLTLPNYYWWYDPVLKEEGATEYKYPRYASKAVGQLLRFSLYVQKLAEKKTPLARHYSIITNANDTIADNAVTKQYITRLEKHGITVTTYEFPKRLQLGSDIIDPSYPDERVEVVYPQLMKMISRQ